MLVRILNFDDSVIKQEHLLKRYRPAIVNLKNIAPRARHWINQKTAQEIKRHLAGELKNAITFLGSGDFHHISRLLIGQFEEPVSVIIFDHHPDWSAWPPRLGCGSWVSNLLKRNNVKKVILFGASSADLDTVSLQEADLGSLKNNRLEIYPYKHKASRVFFRRVPENISLGLSRRPFFTEVYWRELKNKSLKDFIPEVLGRMETKRVYVSIDKDCLNSHAALTNWEEGPFGLEDLLLLLKLIKENLEIIGLDIAGDYSKVEVNSFIKGIISRFDHPKDYSAKGHPEGAINLLNEKTNTMILEALK